MLTYTRVLSAVIIPFLLVAFGFLYFFPGSTGRLFAWTIKPTVTSMVLASAYLGGAVFFARVLRERSWHVMKTGFWAVALFASLLGIATLLHWDRFSHRHVAFWLWAGLYFTTPFLVAGGWLANRRFAAPAGADERRLGARSEWAVALVGLVALVQGVVMFVLPSRVIPIWPWTLTPLTCRVVGAIFCLGAAGAGVLVDRRWTSLKLMVQTALVMITLMLVAAVRARAEFLTDRPLTWVMLAGFIVVFVGAGCLWWTNSTRHGTARGREGSARGREDDTEAGDRQPEQDLPGRQ